MKLHYLTLIFMALVLGAAMMICMLILLYMEIANSNLPTTIPFLILVFGYAIMLMGFKYESNISKKDLGKLFEAETTK